MARRDIKNARIVDYIRNQPDASGVLYTIQLEANPSNFSMGANIRVLNGVNGVNVVQDWDFVECPMAEINRLRGLYNL